MIAAESMFHVLCDKCNKYDISIHFQFVENVISELNQRGWKIYYDEGRIVTVCPDCVKGRRAEWLRRKTPVMNTGCVAWDAYVLRP